jgi:hypothetical protein
MIKQVQKGKRKGEMAIKKTSPKTSRALVFSEKKDQQVVLLRVNLFVF